MNFKELLLKAKAQDLQARETLLLMYRPLLIKEAILDGAFDEDLCQELSATLLRCIDLFRI